MEKLQAAGPAVNQWNCVGGPPNHRNKGEGNQKEIGPVKNSRVRDLLSLALENSGKRRQWTQWSPWPPGTPRRILLGVPIGKMEPVWLETATPSWPLKKSDLWVRLQWMYILNKSFHLTSKLALVGWTTRPRAAPGRRSQWRGIFVLLCLGCSQLKPRPS